MEKNLMAIVDLKLKSKKFDTYQNIKYRRIKYWFTLIWMNSYLSGLKKILTICQQ